MSEQPTDGAGVTEHETPITRILSIDGGGIRGVIPAMVMAEIELRTGRRIADLFDVVAGTSTGGILALGVACPNADRTAPKYTAAQLVDLYGVEGPRIFPHGFLRGVHQVVDPKYSVKGLEGVLKQYFGDTRLSEAMVDVLVPAYDIERRAVRFFRSAEARSTPATRDYPMRLVARATSAAPTYFKPLVLPDAGETGHSVLIDGGVVINDPAMAAYMDDWGGQYAHPSHVMIVSLGTGSQETPLNGPQAASWGLLRWVHPLINVTMDGGPEVTEYWLRRSVGSRYNRLQPAVLGAAGALDNADPTNIAALKAIATKLIADNSAAIDAICAQLTGATPPPPVVHTRGVGVGAVDAPPTPGVEIS